jgi:hypothetical protein
MPLKETVVKVVRKGKTHPVTREAFKEPPKLWPNKDGVLQVDGVGNSSDDGTILPGVGAPSVSSSQHSPLQRPKHRKKTPQEQSSSSWERWRSLKSLDIVSFNLGAEEYFVRWLCAKLDGEEFGAVTVGWVLSNAAFELNVSTETVKRYLMKHTADRAEFKSDGKVVVLREK